jgi:hypothetical protein
MGLCLDQLRPRPDELAFKPLLERIVLMHRLVLEPVASSQAPYGQACQQRRQRQPGNTPPGRWAGFCRCRRGWARIVLFCVSLALHDQTDTGTGRSVPSP